MQNQDFISVCFSMLKTLLNELLNYESIPNCTCGCLQVANDWVMKFLLGLMTHIRGYRHRFY